jgi:tRNA-splicing ligase RtcB
MELKESLVKKREFVYELPANTIEGQRVPVVLYISDELFELLEEGAIRQAVNAATLPGVKRAIYVMPDVHVGYGFPVGGVMATDSEGGVISPGSVGYDINCGVRLISTHLSYKEVVPHIKGVMRSMLEDIPAGVGSTSDIKLSKKEMERVLLEGARWAVGEGYGSAEDLEHIESYGELAFASPESASKEAYERGADELGTVGSGNHFVELQVVEEIYEEVVAQKLGIWEGQVMIMVHSGSRGFGHQVCVDYLKVALESAERYSIELPDPQLACMPFSSKEGQDYFGAMCAAANYAFANRQILGFKAARTLKRYLGLSWEDLGYRLVYDHAHNIAKLERHRVGNALKELVVHRKGATRAFPPYNPEVPPAYRDTGQPVIIPGDMGRASFLLVGQKEAMEVSFGTACHGAGRLMSRRKAKKLAKEKGLERVISGLTVVARGKGTIMEEIPQAYKDVSQVVRVVHSLGIAKVVARLKPIGTLKG